MRTPRRHRDLAPLQDSPLSELGAALAADASEEELAGEQRALHAYRAVSWDRRRRFRPAIWRPAVLSTIIATKLGAAVAAGAVGLGGTAAAAYTGSLPNGLQDFAHKAIKAPPAHAVGPDAKGPAAYGLCQAFAKDKDDEAKEQRKAQERAKERAAEQAKERAAGETPKAIPPGQAKKQEKAQGKGKPHDAPPGLAGKDGSKGKRSVAYRNLVRAAGGEDKLEAYCATVRKDKEAQRSAEASSSPKAKPSKAPKPSKQPATGAPSKVASPTASATTSPTPSAEPTGTPEPSPTG